MLYQVIVYFFFSLNRLQLKHEPEKCLAWIRQGLKENTLSSYINVITQDEKLLRFDIHVHLNYSIGNSNNK